MSTLGVIASQALSSSSLKARSDEALLVGLHDALSPAPISSASRTCSSSGEASARPETRPRSRPSARTGKRIPPSTPEARCRNGAAAERHPHGAAAGEGSRGQPRRGAARRAPPRGAADPHAARTPQHGGGGDAGRRGAEVADRAEDAEDGGAGLTRSQRGKCGRAGKAPRRRGMRAFESVMLITAERVAVRGGGAQQQKGKGRP